MYATLITSMTIMMLTMIMLTVMKMTNMRSNNDREKTSPFECGFDPKNNARTPFSLRFFMLAIIFIVFDIEIVLLMPLPLLSPMMNTIQAEAATMTFLIILLIGLFHEWKEGSLNWSS